MYRFFLLCFPPATHRWQSVAVAGQFEAYTPREPGGNAPEPYYAFNNQRELDAYATVLAQTYPGWNIAKHVLTDHYVSVPGPVKTMRADERGVLPL